MRERHRALVRPLVEKYHGEWIEARGDESLSTFPTALDAVNCALAIQEAVANSKLSLHLGIHLGDIVLQDGEISGDGVNAPADSGFAAAPMSRTQLTSRSVVRSGRFTSSARGSAGALHRFRGAGPCPGPSYR